MGRIAAFALVLTLAPNAFAQESEAERTAAARALFEEGMDAVDARNWERAADLLQRSFDVRPSPVVRFNLALALSEQGRLVEASEHLRALQRDPEAGARIQRPAAERLEAILPRIGRLRIEVEGRREGTEVRLDGRALTAARIGVAQPADPGRHRVTLTRGDDEVAARDVTVESGELATVTLVAPAPRAPTPEEVARTAPVDGTGSTTDAAPGGGVETEWWFWTLMGVLVVGAAVAITVALLTTQQPPPYVVGDSGTVHPTLVEHPTLLEFP